MAATVTVALKDDSAGEWYSFLLSPEEESRLSQDPDFASLLLNSVKKNKNVTSTSEPTITTVSTLSTQASTSQDMDIITEVQVERKLKDFTSPSVEDGDEKFTWNYQSVLALMSLFKQYKDKFESPETKKKNVWKEISKKMQDQGFVITPEQCDKKWRNLRCTYKTVLVKQSKNPGGHKKKWEFFNEMHDICQEDPNQEHTNPLTGTPLNIGFKSTPTPTPLPIYQLVQSTPGTSILKRTLQDIQPSINVISPKKKKTAFITGVNGSEPSEVVVLSESHSVPAVEPHWFASFKQEIRRENDRNIAELKAMHNENLKVLKDRNDILRTLVSLLDPANNKGKET